MKKILLSVIVVILIIGLNGSGIFAVGRASAFFDDEEGSADNAFAGGALDFSLSAGAWEPNETAVNFLPGASATRMMHVIGGGSISFQYVVRITKTAGDDEFCNAFVLDASRDGVAGYHGNLMHFISLPVLIGADGDDAWVFVASLPSGADAPEDASCEFRFDVYGWQAAMADPSLGFNDYEGLENLLESGSSAVSGFSPIADARVEQGSGNSNFGNDTELKIRSKNSSGNRRSFIQFGFHFPGDTDILSAELKAYMSVAPNASRSYQAYRALGSWKEKNPGGITWNNQSSRAAIPSDTVLSGTEKNVWLSWNVTDDMAHMVSGGYTNNGWVVKDSVEDSSTPQEAKFRSREYNNPSFRPVLEIDFSAPAAATTHAVINEVYYEVGPQKGSDPDNEWMEIYNPTGSAINISGWSLCDSASCDVIPVSPGIPAHGFAVIAPASATFTKWSIQPDAVIIALGSNIGGGLSNSGDALILKNSAAAVIDAMSYGSDTSRLNPAAPLSGKGKSLARVIKGYDTDTAEDWVINATPNPGTNPSASGAETMRFTSEGIEVADLRDGLAPLEDDGSIVSDVEGGDTPTDEENGAVFDAVGVSASLPALTDGSVLLGGGNSEEYITERPVTTSENMSDPLSTETSTADQIDEQAGIALEANNPDITSTTIVTDDQLSEHTESGKQSETTFIETPFELESDTVTTSETGGAANSETGTPISGSPGSDDGAWKLPPADIPASSEGAILSGTSAEAPSGE